MVNIRLSVVSRVKVFRLELVLGLRLVFAT